jgi:hypothetical protein
MSLKIIGNFKNWIQQEWLDYMMITDGSCFPKEATEESEPGMVQAAILNKNPYTGEYVNDGTESWDPKCVCCITYREDQLPFEIGMPFKINYPYEWFFMKLKPGMMQPIHQDYSLDGKDYANGSAVSNKENVIRYWMPMQDYMRGHMFLYDDAIIKDYTAGDLFLHDGEDVWHGGGNIGHATRFTFNLTIYPKGLTNTDPWTLVYK